MTTLRKAAAAFNLDPDPEPDLDRRLDELCRETYRDELPPEITDGYEPTAEDLEWIAATNLDSFLPPRLVFPDWLAEQARQHALRGEESPEYSYGGWHAWLGMKIDELCQVALWLDADGPATFDDRREACDELTRAKSYDAGYEDGRGAR